jgi:hypothetical protein
MAEPTELDQYDNLHNWQKGKKPPKKRVLISTAYKKILGLPIPEDVKDAFEKWGVDDDTTWAELIAFNVVRRSMGMVDDDKICFRAITELRETTEGKTPEKAISLGANLELLNLAQIMAGEPAAAGGDDEDGLKRPSDFRLSEPIEGEYTQIEGDVSGTETESD